jgi:hypothetical protein
MTNLYMHFHANLIDNPTMAALFRAAEELHRRGGRGSCPVTGVTQFGQAEPIGELVVTDAGFELRGLEPAEST